MMALAPMAEAATYYELYFSYSSSNDGNEDHKVQK
jgi:hypothetical protein